MDNGLGEDEVLSYMMLHAVCTYGKSLFTHTHAKQARRRHVYMSGDINGIFDHIWQ